MNDEGDASPHLSTQFPCAGGVPFPVGPADQLLTFPVPVHQPFHAFLWITVHEELGCADRARPCLTHDLSMSDCEARIGVVGVSRTA